MLRSARSLFVDRNITQHINDNQTTGSTTTRTKNNQNHLRAFKYYISTFKGVGGRGLSQIVFEYSTRMIFKVFELKIFEYSYSFIFRISNIFVFVFGSKYESEYIRIRIRVTKNIPNIFVFVFGPKKYIRYALLAYLISPT